MFNSKLIEICSFKVLPTDEINEILFFFPDVEPFNLNFQEMGITSIFALPNLGSTLYILAFYVVLIIFALVVKYIGQYCKCCKKLHLSLYKAIFWGGFLRFWMEIYLDVGLCTALNYVMMQDSEDFPAIAISNGLTYGLGCILMILPVWIIIFYST